MSTAAILGLMLLAALLPFALLTHLMRIGKDGAALTLLSLTGGVLAILLFAAGRPMGLDPVGAMTAALLVALPALLGGGAGALLGWLIRRRGDIKLRRKNS